MDDLETIWAYQVDGVSGRGVRFALGSDGRPLCWDKWSGLGAKAQIAFLAIFKMVSLDPNLQCRNPTKFKQVDGRLYEFKSNTHQARIFAFREGQAWFLTGVLTGKKENDLPHGEVERQLASMEEARRQIKVSRSP